MPDPKKLDITVVVNGQSTVVNVFENDPLSKVVVDALQQTGNSGQPAENWELRTSDGTILHDLAKAVGDYNFSFKDELFLSLKAGVGGSN